MWFLEILCSVWAYMPFFALTDDMGYLTANHGPDQVHKYYISFISILFGEKKIQFFSFPIKQPGERFIIFRIICLSKMDAFNLSDEKAEQLENDYKTHYNTLHEDERNIEKEELLRHLTEQQSRIEISYNKINAFTTIIVAIIPIAIAFINWDIIKSLNVIGWGVLIVLIYSNINLCAWIFQTINVRSIMASTFGDLKRSREKAKEQNWQIYYDWQQTKRKADMYVSFVIYTKVWIVAVIVLTIIFSVGLPFDKYDNKKNLIDNHVYTFQPKLVEQTYEQSAVTWNALLAELQTDEYAKVLILNNGADVENIASKLELFKHQKIIWLLDDTLDKDEVKIILEE